MEAFFYRVRCTFDDASVADRWCTWLEERHLMDVMNAGAMRAEVVRLGPLEAEALYVFASAEAFADYERDHAPRLRGEGLETFPLELGLRYERATGSLRGPR